MITIFVRGPRWKFVFLLTLLGWAGVDCPFVVGLVGADELAVVGVFPLTFGSGVLSFLSGFVFFFPAVSTDALTLAFCLPVVWKKSFMDVWKKNKGVRERIARFTG